MAITILKRMCKHDVFVWNDSIVKTTISEIYGTLGLSNLSDTKTFGWLPYKFVVLIWILDVCFSLSKSVVINQNCYN